MKVCNRLVGHCHTSRYSQNKRSYHRLCKAYDAGLAHNREEAKVTLIVLVRDWQILKMRNEDKMYARKGELATYGNFTIVFVGNIASLRDIML